MLRLDEQDSARHARCLRKRTVARQEDAVQDFRERDIDGVVRREILAHLPYAPEQRFMGIPLQVQGTKIVERDGCGIGVDGALPDITPQSLHDLEIGKMRSV